jgi:D-alanyl-D-alanine dipeptidase
MVFLRLVSAKVGAMHQAMKNVRHFIQSVRIMSWALVIAGRGTGRRMALAAIFAAGCLAGAAAQAPKLPAGFVYLRDIDPTIIQDMRYAGANNFVGRPLKGYQAAECVVKREVGALLKSIQEELALQNLSLKMFDCYRPTRAVADMVAWSRDGRLFRLGYIATHSGHSTGAALDLTLVDLKADNSATFDAARDYGDCTANVSLRAPDGSVDMGTGYDCSDVKSHTAAKSITAAQRRWREKLVLLMARRGFVNYSKEWWHFSLPGASGQAYDFPIIPRK